MPEPDTDYDLCAACGHARFYHGPVWSLYEACGAQIDNGGCSDPEHCDPLFCRCPVFQEAPHA